MIPHSLGMMMRTLPFQAQPRNENDQRFKHDASRGRPVQIRADEAEVGVNWKDMEKGFGDQCSCG